MRRLRNAYSCPDPQAARAGLRTWFTHAVGQALIEQEQALLAQLLPNLFGYHLLQIGDPHGLPLLNESRISRRVLLQLDGAPHPCPPAGVMCVRGDGHTLPFASASIDVIVLAHTLEYVADPHQLLREVERCLIPEGKLVILGFNPFSLFGGARLLLGWRRQAPWCGHFYSVLRVKDWLALLGFDTLRLHGYFFRPPWGKRVFLDRLTLLDAWGGRWLSVFGGCFLLVAVKRVSTITPIRPRWRAQRRLLPEIGQPTVRSHERNRP